MLITLAVLQWRWNIGSGTVVLAALVCAALALWSYWPGLSSRRTAWFLAALRGSSLILILLVFLQPAWVVPVQIVQKPLLAIGVDISGSMNFADVRFNLDGRMRSRWQSRLEAVRRAMTRDGGGLLHRLASNFKLYLFAFDEDVRSEVFVDDPQDVGRAIRWMQHLQAGAGRTDFVRCLERVAGRFESPALAATVLLTDGRQTVRRNLSDAASILADVGCGLIAVGVGAKQARPDVAILRVDAPRRVLPGDAVAVSVDLAGYVLRAGQKVSIQIRTADDKELIVSRTVQAPAGRFLQMVEVTFRPQWKGPRRIVVRAVGPADEVDLQNNVVSAVIEVVDKKVRVLYVEGYPRFEYRFLKNLLLREPTVSCSCLLLSADPQFRQEGDLPLRYFPRTAEDLDGIDVLILGDFDPSDRGITEQEIRLVADWVRDKAGGVGWIAGQRGGLQAWARSALGPLMPVEVPAGSAGSSRMGPYRLRLTDAGRASQIFRLDAAGASAGKLMEILPEWYWAAEVGAVRPFAEALAVLDNAAGRTEDLPIVVAGYYGSGRVFYCGSDDVWRWRSFDRAEPWSAFWLQVIRYLAAGRVLGERESARLFVEPARLTPGQSATITLHLTGSAAVRAKGRRLRAEILDASGALVGTVSLVSDLLPGVFRAAFRPPRAGAFTVRVPLPGPRKSMLESSFVVQPVDSERLMTQADPESLRRLVAEVRAAGQRAYYIDLEQIGRLADLPLGNSRIVERLRVTPLWDNGAVLALVVLLLGCEWFLRRSSGLA